MSKLIASIHSPKSEYHLSNYVKPWLNVENGSELCSNYQNFSAGHRFTLIGTDINEDKYCAVGSDGNTVFTVPISKVAKHPDGKKTINKGLNYETTVGKFAVEVGIMEGMTAGCSGKPDLFIKAFDGSQYNIELKDGIKVVAGQAVLHHNIDWDISKRAQEKYPLFSACIREATCDGQPLMGVVNELVKAPVNKVMKEAVSIYSDPMDFSPVMAFMRDKNVDLIHFRNHGTFNVSGRLEGFEDPFGCVRFRVRTKHDGTLTVQVEVKFLEKAGCYIPLETLEGMSFFKERYLGYGESAQKPSFGNGYAEEVFRGTVSSSGFQGSGDRKD